MKQQSWIVMSLVFALIIAVFAIINVETVEVDFLFMTTNAPLILVILLSVLMGALLIVGFSFSKIYQLQREVKALKNEKSEYEQASLNKEEAVQNKTEANEEKFEVDEQEKNE